MGVTEGRRDHQERLPDSPRLWVLLYILAAIGVAALVPAVLPGGDALALESREDGWSLSAGMRLSAEQGSLAFRSIEAGTQTASRFVPVAADVSFLATRVCLNAELPAAAFGAYLASVRNGELDFSRHYSLRQDTDEPSCYADLIPRRAGDAGAILQLQLRDTTPSVTPRLLTVAPRVHNPIWRPLRLCMLLLGLMLIVWWFSGYLRSPQLLASACGLAVVAGILFGCTVSVELKADIYALLTGVRDATEPRPLAELLQVTFPEVGSSLFTQMHALLFAAATLFLSLAQRRAWLDLLLLGIASETLQLFVPGRGPGISDVLVDWSGVAAATLLLVLVRAGQRVGLFLKQ